MSVKVKQDTNRRKNMVSEETIYKYVYKNG